MNISGKNRGRLQKLLDDWYGQKRGALEIIPHLPDYVSLDSAVKEITTKFKTPEQIKMMELKKIGRKLPVNKSPVFRLL